MRRTRHNASTNRPVADTAAAPNRIENILTSAGLVRVLPHSPVHSSRSRRLVSQQRARSRRKQQARNRAVKNRQVLMTADMHMK
jgi:hypothetical protein